MAHKIGIDFHGVISSAPEMFAKFCHEIRLRGVLVYVISGGPKKDVERFLNTAGIEYDSVWAILDFYEQQGQVRYYDDGSYQVDTALWDKAKAEYCQREGIVFHIDDSPVYGRYFVTPYCTYDMATDVCVLGKLTIDFKKPVEAAREVANLLALN